MVRALYAIAVFAVVAGVVAAQDEIRRGTVKAIDAEKGTVTITAGGKDETFALTASTRVMGTDGKAVAKPFEDKGLSPGAAVMFKADKDGKGLVGLKFRAGNAGQPPPKFDSSKLKPLSELGTDKYQGHEGGLYASGTNKRPKKHETAGVALAKAIRPLGADGKPANNGKVVMLAVGMSNTTQVFSTFKKIADADKDRHPDLVLVDGAQGGMTAARNRFASTRHIAPTQVTLETLLGCDSPSQERAACLAELESDGVKRCVTGRRT